MKGLRVDVFKLLRLSLAFQCTLRVTYFLPSFNLLRSTLNNQYTQLYSSYSSHPDSKDELKKGSGSLQDSLPGHPSSRKEERKDEHLWYLRYLKWTPLPMFSYLLYHQYRHLIELEGEENIGLAGGLKTQIEITCYRMFPWRAFSKAWGWMNAVQLPVWARSPFLSWYSRSFGCNICEAEVEDLCQYRNLGEFFRRKLKNGVRPLAIASPIVSPVDGTVLHFGRIQGGGKLEQVKGVTYSLQTFLGPNLWSKENNNAGGDYAQTLLVHPDKNVLYQCVIYLAPGDYHRFHSPTDWQIHYRRHFSGELMSVNPRVARWISGLFSLNERAVYVGDWEHGFFSMTAVGATNVGSIRVYKDQDLITNCWSGKKNTFLDMDWRSPFSLKKGEDFGEFNLGSTIVLVFEAPRNFSFEGLEAGGKVKMGQSLFTQTLPKMSCTNA